MGGKARAKGKLQLMSDSDDTSDSSDDELFFSSELKGKGKCFKGKGKGKGKLMSDSDDTSATGDEEPVFETSSELSDSDPPLELLFGVTTLIKQYEVQGFLPRMLGIISSQLSLSNFDEIASFAIGQDISPLRMKCLRFADGNKAVKRAFKRRALCPEVMFELEALWDQDANEGKGVKRRRFW